MEATVVINSVGHPTPYNIKGELEALALTRSMFGLTMAAYSSVVKKGEPFNMLITLTSEDARRLCEILATDGTHAVVQNTADGSIIFDNAIAAVQNVPAPVVAAAPMVRDNNYFFLEEGVRDVCEAIGCMAKGYAGTITALFDGPSGYGKTSIAALIARKLGKKLFVMDMSLIQDVEEIAGTREVTDGTTSFKLNEFSEAVMAGGHVVVLDEMNRTFASALNSLLPLLDFRGEMVIRGQHVKVGPGTIIIGTRNLGVGFTGTSKSDVALINRFQFVAHFGQIAATEESKLLQKRVGLAVKDADQIAEVVNNIRQRCEIECSPRNSLAIAEMVNAGVPMRLAFQFNLVHTVLDIEERRQVEEIVTSSLSVYAKAASAFRKTSKLFA